MKRISSKFTFFYKRIFPVAWFGFLGFFVYETVSSGSAEGDPMFLLMPLIMAVAGFFIMRTLVQDLADSVDDHGSYLVVRKGSIDTRIELSNIMNVNASAMQNPPRVTLRLIKPSDLGKEISFNPLSRFSLNPFATSPLVDELIERVHRARPRSAR